VPVTLFLLTAAAFAVAPWLHPPLSPDVRSLHVPLGLDPVGKPSPEEILHGPRRTRPDSVGVVLLGLISCGAVLALYRPRRLGSVAGLLLCAALGTSAAAALNHPALVELMDLEYEQRLQWVVAATHSPLKKGLLSTTPNGRAPIRAAPREDEQRGDPIRGWQYLHHGCWLVPWAALGVLLGSSGPLRRRLAVLCLWSLLGAGLGCGLCGRRLCAEYYWLQARDLEGRCDYEAARRALESAIALCPEFARLERTWLLAGKLDHRAARLTPQARFFQAYQFARDREAPRAIAYREDLPWLIARTFDYREGLAAPPAGFDLTESPSVTGTENYPGTQDYRLGLSGPQGQWWSAYHFDRATGSPHALALMQDLLASGWEGHPAVRSQASRLWADRAMNYFLAEPIFCEAGLAYYGQNRRLIAARDAWYRAHELMPTRADSTFALAALQIRLDPEHPERMEAELAPLLIGPGDRILRADVLAALGEAYLKARQVAKARQCFAASFDLFHLPRKLNYRAQKGLGGV
jgi:hypothetical protein